MDDLYLLLSDEEVNTFLPWYPVKNLEETKAFYEARYAANYEKAHAYDYAVCLKENNVPVGYVNVKMDDSYDLGVRASQGILAPGNYDRGCRRCCGAAETGWDSLYYCHP